MSGDVRRDVSPWLRARSGWLDRLAAVVLLPVLGPVIAVLAWVVRRREGKPAFVALDRVGRDGARFRMWKLRSMRVAGPDGVAGGAAITAGGDDRITPTGAWLRRWRVDELPQVWNVVRGDMGLLGPRPETPSMVDLDDPRWAEVLRVRPGIAGPTQLVIERWESDTLAQGDADDRYGRVILPVKLAVDAWYVRRATPLTDLQVVGSLLQRFVLRREGSGIEAAVRRAVPEASAVPVPGETR